MAGIHKVVVLLSGGLDSATVLAMAVERGYHVYPITFLYNQKHSVEAHSAEALINHYRSNKHALVEPGQCVRIEQSYLYSALTDKSVSIPLNRKTEDMQDIPNTYVPARNSMFLAMATGYAESVGANAVWCGFNAVDYSGYPDCRQEFVDAMQEALSLGTKRGVEGNPIRIRAPIIHMSKSQVVQQAKQMDVPIHLTWSCYVGGKRPCGECDSCIIRAKGFKEAGVKDTALEVDR